MSATGTTVVAVGSSSANGLLQTFEGFLKKAGRLVGVALSDIAKLALPIASFLIAVSPKMSGTESAFLASVELISNAVIEIEQKWSTLGAATGAQKLADVLVLVEQPVLALFAEVGVAVDGAYVVNLVNGIVALLNAQPGDILATLMST